MKKKIVALFIVLFVVISCFHTFSLAEEDEDIMFEEQLDKENEIQNDGSDIKEYSNFNNDYFNNVQNIALNCDVTALGYDVNQVGGVDSRFPKENAVDGDTTTMFGTYKTAKTGYITLKFSEKKQFNKIVLSESSLSIREYTISYSNDGIKWTKLADIEGMNGIKEDVKYYFDKKISKEMTWQDIMSIENTISNLYSIHYFDTIEARYLKFEVAKVANQQSNTAWGFYINEIGVFNETAVDYTRFDIAYKKAADLYDVIKDDLSFYDSKKVEKFTGNLEKYKNVKSEIYTQSQIEEICDDIVDARIALIRSKKYSDSDFQRVTNNIIATFSANKDYTEQSDINSRQSGIQVGINASESMIKNNTSLLWDDIGTFENAKYTQTPVNIQNLYKRIREMALAATGKYSEKRGDPTLLANISYALKIADTYWYNPDIPWFDSSMWSQMLGTPPLYSDILVILQGYLPQEELEYYANRLSEQIKNDYMNWSGVNRMNLALANAKVGVVLKEYWRIDNLRISVEEEFAYVDKTSENGSFYAGNGYYSDGTFIYHDEVPYNAGYGQDGMTYNINGIIALNDSPWELPNEKLISCFVDIINKGYDPIVVNGYSMSMMMGRNITREGMERKKACELANTIALVINLIDEPYRTEFKSMIKSWFLDGTDWTRNVNNEVKAILRDDTIPVRDSVYLNKVYHYGDRVVHRRGDWSFGLSMSSSRIKMYEGINNENKKGWYTGSGVTYLYNSDKSHYNDDYWFAVDMYRLPGTTVETSPRQAIRYQGETVTPYDTVGGVTLDGKYGVAQMELYQWESDLTGRKSWFMFDDEVVCVGSGITSFSDNSVETTVENRMLDKNSVISINNMAISSDKVKVASVKTAHVVGRKNSQIGYYFPKSTTLNVLKDERTHEFLEVSSTLPSRKEDYTTRTFGTMYIDHGKSPENEKYSYVILPDKTASETEEYAQNPQVEIVANEEFCHIVKEKNLGITAVTLFEDKKIVVDGIHLFNKGSYIISEKNGEIEVAVSDTTQTNDGVVNIILDRKGNNIINKDSNITAELEGSRIYIKVDMKSVKGESSGIKLSTESKTSFLSYFQIVAKAEAYGYESFEDDAEGTIYFQNDKAGSFDIESATTLGNITNAVLKYKGNANSQLQNLNLSEQSMAEIVTGITNPVRKTGEGAITDPSVSGYYSAGNLESYFPLVTNTEYNWSAYSYFENIPDYLSDAVFFRLNRKWRGDRTDTNNPNAQNAQSEVLTFDINKTATVYYIYPGSDSTKVDNNSKWLSQEGWTLCDERILFVSSQSLDPTTENPQPTEWLLFKKTFNVSAGETVNVKIGGFLKSYWTPLVIVDWNGENRDYLFASSEKEDSGNGYLAVNTRKYAPESANVPEIIKVSKDINSYTKDKSFYQIDYKVRVTDNDVLRQFNSMYKEDDVESDAELIVSFQPGENKEITIGSSNLKVGNYEIDKWYNISVVVDAVGSKADVFIDNKKVTSESVYLTIAGTPLESNLSTVHFTQATKNYGEDDDSFYQFHIDDFKIKTQGTPVAVSEKLQTEGRKATNLDVEIVFGNDMEKSTADKIKLKKAGDESGKTIPVVVETTDYITYKVSSVNELAVDTEYELFVEDAKDFYGNNYSDSFKFLTIEADYELQIRTAVSKALSDIPSVVTKDLDLPLYGIDGVLLSWDSKTDDVLTDRGVVVRDNNEHEITIEVTGSKKGFYFSDIKKIKVPGLNITSNATVTSDIANGNYITDDDPSTAWIINSSALKGECTLSFAEKSDFNLVKFLITAPENSSYKLLDVNTSEIIKTGTLDKAYDNQILELDCEAFNSSKINVIFEKTAGSEIKVYSMLLYVDEQAKVDLDAKELDLGDTTAVVSDFAFNLKGKRGTTISWLSADTSVVANDGSIVRPFGADKTVKVTATISLENTTSKVREFYITVKARAQQPAGGGGGGGGGSFSYNGGASSDEKPETTVPQPEQEFKFSDVPDNHWAKDMIYYLKDKGILNGINDNEFAPDNFVTREQFIKMLVLALDLKSDVKYVPFSDVDKNAWYYSVICTAYDNGIVKGAENEAGIGENITRQDVCVMIKRAIDNSDITISAETNNFSFIDNSLINEYAKDSIIALCSYGMVSGYSDGSFKPDNNITRAECSKLIYTLIQLMSK